MEMEQLRANALSVQVASEPTPQAAKYSQHREEHGQFGPMSEVNALPPNQVVVSAHDHDSSFNNRVAGTLTEQQRSAYSQQFKKGAPGLSNNPVGPPSHNENPMAKDWHRLNPNDRLTGQSSSYPDHLARPSAGS